MSDGVFTSRCGLLHIMTTLVTLVWIIRREGDLARAGVALYCGGFCLCVRGACWSYFCFVFLSLGKPTPRVGSIKGMVFLSGNVVSTFTEGVPRVSKACKKMKKN